MVEKEERCVVIGMLLMGTVAASGEKAAALVRAVMKVRFATERPREELRRRRLAVDNMVDEEVVTHEEERIVMCACFLQLRRKK
jgi:hypothetical protein